MSFIHDYGHGQWTEIKLNWCKSINLLQGTSSTKQNETEHHRNKHTHTHQVPRATPPPRQTFRPLQLDHTRSASLRPPPLLCTAARLARPGRCRSMAYAVPAPGRAVGYLPGPGRSGGYLPGAPDGPRAPARTPGKSSFPEVPPNHHPGEGSADPTRQAGAPPARAADRSLSRRNRSVTS